MEKFIKEYKKFKKQTFIYAIICWIATAVYLTYFPEEKLLNDIDWLVVPLGAIIYTFIFISCYYNIKKYEKINNK